MDHHIQITRPSPNSLPVRLLLLGLTAVVLAALLVPAIPAIPAHADTISTFTPGAAWDDTSGNPLQMHGLGIIKVGSTWYAYGEDKAGETSANTSFQAIPCTARPTSSTGPSRATR